MRPDDASFGRRAVFPRTIRAAAAFSRTILLPCLSCSSGAPFPFFFHASSSVTLRPAREDHLVTQFQRSRRGGVGAERVSADRVDRGRTTTRTAGSVPCPLPPPPGLSPSPPPPSFSPLPPPPSAGFPRSPFPSLALPSVPASPPWRRAGSARAARPPDGTRPARHAAEPGVGERASLARSASLGDSLTRCVESAEALRPRDHR